MIKQGWTLRDIDDMDIFFFFELIGSKEVEPVGFIDDVL